MIFVCLSFSAHILSGLIIFLLITILISCLLSSYSFSALAENFNDNCVTGAAVTLKRITSPDEALTDQAKREADFYGQKVLDLDKEFRSYYLAKELREADETGAIPKTQIYQFLNSKRNPTTENPKQPNSTTYMVPTLPSNDTEFFKNCKSLACDRMFETQSINWNIFHMPFHRSNQWIRHEMGRSQHMLAVLLFSSGRNHGHHRMDCSHFNQSTWGRTKIVYVRIEFFNVCIENGFFYYFSSLVSLFAYFSLNWNVS